MFKFSSLGEWRVEDERRVKPERRRSGDGLPVPDESEGRVRQVGPEDRVIRPPAYARPFLSPTKS